MEAIASVKTERHGYAKDVNRDATGTPTKSLRELSVWGRDSETSAHEASIEGHENDNDMSSLWLHDFASFVLALRQCNLPQETANSWKARRQHTLLLLYAWCRARCPLHVQEILNKEIDEWFHVRKTIPL